MTFFEPDIRRVYNDLRSCDCKAENRGILIYTNAEMSKWGIRCESCFERDTGLRKSLERAKQVWNQGDWD